MTKRVRKSFVVVSRLYLSSPTTTVLTINTTTSYVVNLDDRTRERERERERERVYETDTPVYV